MRSITMLGFHLMRILFAFILLILTTEAKAQPPNDNCAAAIPINISNGGFGLGLFTSVNSDMTNATLQTGESFASSIIVAGLNRKSVWYKFSLPTTRAARVSLAQPGSTIQNGDVGFAVYKANTCLPGNAQISTKFTPIEIFGGSFHPCVDAGDYLVQVSSNLNANGPIFITIDISDTTNGIYDKPVNAYQFTNININRITSTDFLVQCQSIDSAAENCLPNGSFIDYTKSTWHTFKTPNYFDWFSVLLSSMDNTPNYYVVGYRIYQGNSRTTPLSSLILLGGCDSLIINGIRPDKKMYKCGQLLPNTDYTIQLLYHKDFIKTLRLAVAWNGVQPTNAPEPVSTITAPNNMGTLLANSTGINNTATDYLACNSRHNQHSCPSSMPVAGVLNNANGLQYNLSSFFYFNLATTTTVNIIANGPCFQFYFRLYKQNLTINCTDLDTANIINTFTTYSGFITCLQPGNYVLQVMGVDSVFPRENLHWSNLITSTAVQCLNFSLGSLINLSITAKTEVSTNNFSLSAPGRFEKINPNGGGVMQPLVPYTRYVAATDSFGCANTVLPQANLDCTGPYNSSILTKAAYREFVIADSFMLQLLNPNNLNSKLYLGDANALATAQGVFNYPQNITGLVPYSKCIFSDNALPQYACVIPGTYSLVALDNRIGVPSNFEITPRTTIAKYTNPANADDMGDLWTQPFYWSNYKRSNIDTFTCRDNPAVIDGIQPCAGQTGYQSTKQHYRQFYLSKPTILTIYNNLGVYGPYLYGNYSLFRGKATDGLGTLTNMGASGTCFTYLTTAQCEALQPGWYTLVTYGAGQTFSNPLPANPGQAHTTQVGRENGFYYTLAEACPAPKFNRPHKASVDTLTGLPYKIEWGPGAGHTAAYPVTSKKYTLNVENFDCSQDTAFIRQNILACDPSNSKKLAFYVFEITQESYIQIDNIPTGFWCTVYAFDVRTADSVRLRTEQPLQTCLNKPYAIEFCKLQPGFYTFIFYVTGNYTCNQFTPTIYVDQVGASRFDHATNAYDFGKLIPDSTWYSGKPGDVNPLNSSRTASNDFFYCTTGAQPNDPGNASCLSLYNPNIYNPGTNIVLHPDNNTAPTGDIIDRRNLWYTFNIDQPGWIRVKVKNKTPGKNQDAFHQYPFAVFKSDVNGLLPFNQVVSTGQVDSTLLQGLTFIYRNYVGNYYCAGAEEIVFYVSPCSFVPTRYYVLVENRNTFGFGAIGVRAVNPNSQVEVSLLQDSVTAVPPKFDHFSQAYDMGLVNSGTRTGDVDNFTCATRDVTDPLPAGYTNCLKTLWYKFSTTVTGNIRYRAYYGGGSKPYPSQIQLYRQILPGDSSANGLRYLPYTSIVPINGQEWASSCISPGSYYLILPGCDAINEDVYPQIEIIPQAGDFCSTPMVATLTGPGTAVVPVRVDCHTIGTDYGEFNPTLTCPAGAATNLYKTSWYRLDITGVDTLDVTVFINENTNASSTDIKYRMMTGNCGAMQEQSCVQDAQTQNTYKCLAPGNSYYVQIMTPTFINGNPVIGTIDLNISAIIHVDTCLPASTCIAVANFTSNFDCTVSQYVRFINNSTYGSSIINNWDFGYNNQTSTAVSPTFLYPALTVPQTYTVKLVITNTLCNRQDSVIQTITIPARPAANLGRDTVICNNGTSVTLDATSHPGATYYWFNGSTQPTITLSGVYPNAWVEVTYAGCKARDTVSILVNPIAKRPLQTRALCNVTQVTLDAYRGFGEQYLWNTAAITPSITVTQPGYFWVDMYWSGCYVRDSFNVISSSLTPLGNDTTLCQNQLPFTANATVNGATSYRWQNNSTNSTFVINQPGLYWVEILIGGCTYRDTLIVAVDSVITTNAAANICMGQTYTLPWGAVVNTSGVYRDTLRYASGCDSLRRIVNLTVQGFTTTTTNPNICNGQNYTLPWGAVVTTAGTYRDTLRYVSGCDSLRRIVNLTVQDFTTTTTNPNICSGQNYTLPWGTVVNTAGVYRDTLRYGSGCDSLRRIVNLTVQDFITTTTNPTICIGQSYTLPWGNVVTVTGVYRDTLRYSTGCDSLRRIVNLTVQDFTTTTTNPNICSGQNYTLPWGTVVNTGGVYRDTLRYATGCDSVRRIVNLTVQDFTTNTTNANICFGQNYTLPWGAVVTTAGIYRDTLRYTTGCDSIRRIVNLTVQNFTTTNTSVIICTGQSYTLPWGAVVNTSGIYRDTLRFTTGCDSLRRIVNLTVQDFTTTSTNANICAGQTYTLPWGLIVSTAGIYMDTLRYPSGCDSIRRIVNLTLQDFTTTTTNASICIGQSYTLPWGNVVTTSGVYRDTLRYSSGCDSLRRIVNLAVQDFTTTNTNANICIGQSFTLPWGTVVTTAGIYRDTLRFTGTGCDSLRRIVDLTVQDFTTTSTNANICAGQSYTLPWGQVVSTAGVYRDTLRYVSGCDSVRRIVNLTLQDFTTTTTNANICIGQSYTLPWGNIVTTQGVYRDTLRYSTGCDSLRRIVNLTVQNFTTTNTNANICIGQSYTLPWGAVVTTAGVYRDTLRFTGTGCDSLRRIVNLTVQAFTISSNNANICSGQSYTLPWGAVVTTTGIYRDTLRYTTGCDSLRRTVNLTVQDFTTINTNASICIGLNYTLPWGTVVNTTGIYRDTLRYSTGCDSIRRIVNLTVQNFTTTTTNANICSGQNYTLPWGTVVTTTGVYRDTLRYITGCDSIRRIVNLTVQNFTTTTANANICGGLTYTLPWGTVVNTGGIYRDTLRYATGCDSVRRIVNLTVQNSTLLTTNDNICEGFTYTLPWGTIVSSAGTYRDTLRYVTGCDSILKTVILKQQNFSVDTYNVAICAGQNYSLPWGAVINTAGVYRDTLHYASGCDSIRRSFTITVNPLPVPAISSSNDVNCALGTTKLKANNGVQYLWSPAGSLSNSNISNPIASPTVNTLYRVTVTGANGCTASDSILVRFNNANTQNKYLVPSAFTPNNDGLNDCFGVPHWGSVTDFSLVVFNRWGETVFKSNNPTSCWDGNLRGVKQNAGAFIYVINANGICGPILRKGTVILVR